MASRGAQKTQTTQTKLSPQAQSAYSYMRQDNVSTPDRDYNRVEDKHSYYLRSEQQHDFAKVGVTAAVLNHSQSSEYKKTETDIVTISEEASAASLSYEDGPTIQGFLCIENNYDVHWPNPPSGDRLVRRTQDIQPPPQNPTWNSKNIKQILKGTWSRCIVEITNDKGTTQPWQISSVVTLEPSLDQGGWFTKTDRIDRLPKGRNLLQALDIPNGSICIVDAQGSAGNFLKDLKLQNSTKYYTENSPLARARYSRGPEKPKIYLYINPVIQADPAPKIKHTNRALFNAEGDVELQALVSRTDVSVQANNGQLRMRYDIKHSSKGLGADNSRTALGTTLLGRIQQTWTAVQKVSGERKETVQSQKRRSLVVKDANKNNSINQIAKKFDSYVKDNAFFRPGSAGTKRGAALGFQRKAGGDRFQGWTTNNIANNNVTVNVTVYSYGKDGSRWKTRAIKQESNGFGPPESRPITDFTNVDEIEEFVITQDIPFLFWCLKNDVNVLFGSPGSAARDDFIGEPRKYIYFKKI